LLAAAAAVQPEAAIRAERARLNAAIGAHDVKAIRGSFTPDYTILPGSSGLPFDLDGFLARMTAGFADPTFVTYVRTPQEIRVSQNRKRASEAGRWVGSWHKSDGTMRLSGTYFATWVPMAGQWKLKNEVYVSLSCTGSKACAEVY
jgi:ketosteroid isomerase-like protein